MIVRSAQGSVSGSGAEVEVVKALSEAPGVALSNFLVSSARTVREIDLIWITPFGISVVETKGTRLSGAVQVSLNGAWTIGGKTADFPSGPNPIQAARKAAQLLKATLSSHRAAPGFITPAITVVGDRLRFEPLFAGDTVVTTPAALLESLAEAQGAAHLTASMALAVLTALDVSDITLEDLLAEGFEESSTPPAALSAKDRRAFRKRAELVEQAEAAWAASNKRRTITGAVATVVAIMLLVWMGNLYAAGFGLLTGILFAFFDLFRKSRLEGRRTKGPLAIVQWLLTLGPLVGIGSVVGVVAFTTFTYSYEVALASQIGVLVALALAASTLTGKSSYIFPPAQVVERSDPLGRPTGVFYLADVSPSRHKTGADHALVETVEADE